MADGLTVTCSIDGQKIDFTLPPATSNEPSKLCISLPKAGSTLLYRMMQPIAAKAGLTYYALQEMARHAGIIPAQLPAEASAVFREHGYFYGGFRAIPPNLSIPAWAGGNTVVLVRDPRDMLVSLYFSQAFSHGAPGREASEAAYQAFIAQRQEAATREIDAFVLGKIGVTQKQFALLERKLAGVPHRLYRYEDVIFDKRAWLKDMVDYLKLKVSDDVIREVAQSQDERPKSEDVKAHVRQVTPGDHKKKLKPGTIEKLTSEFKQIRAQYNYD